MLVEKHESRILRWVVPVDGQPCRVPGRIVFVASRTNMSVEVWTEPGDPPDRVVQVVGTGDVYPDHWAWLGTSITPDRLVWHLMNTGEAPTDAHRIASVDLPLSVRTWLRR